MARLGGDTGRGWRGLPGNCEEERRGRRRRRRLGMIMVRTNNKLTLQLLTCNV